MSDGTRRRERKKAETRERIADVAAALFARAGYDATSMADIASAADVSVQTAYNYFPMKHELVLDRAEQFGELYRVTLMTRAGDVSPAAAMRPLIHADIDRALAEAPDLLDGEFPVQCVISAELRRFALQMREEHVDAITDALQVTNDIATINARAHAAALIAVVQAVADGIGHRVFENGYTFDTAETLRREADDALDDLARTFDYPLRPEEDIP